MRNDPLRLPPPQCDNVDVATTSPTPRLNILWASDGSDSALAASPLIDSLVASVAATLHVLTVAPAPMFSGARLDPVYLKPWPAKERRAALERAMSVARRSVQRLESTNAAIEPKARFGHPIQEILRHADQQSVDLIALGAKGHSNLRLMLLGSVTQGVLEYAKRPVLIVRPGSASVTTAVVGIDGSGESLRALQFLQGLSPEPGALLALTRVVQMISQRRTRWSHQTDAYGAEARRLNDEAMKRAEEDLTAAHDLLNRSVSTEANEIAVGRSGEQLLKAAAQRKADLNVVGSRRPSRARKYLLGSTAEMIAREASARYWLSARTIPIRWIRHASTSTLEAAPRCRPSER